MKNYKYRAFIKGLRSKGFKKKQKRKRTTPHDVYVLYNEDGKPTNVKLSPPNPHKKKEIPEFMVKRIAYKLGLEFDFFCDVIDCPRTQTDLLNFFRASNRITQ